MKMFRLALAGALPAFVLLVCIQLNARVKVAAPSQSRQLFFEDRVAYQRAIEEVYWRHRIWPKQRPDRKPSLDAVMSQATIEKKVQDYLRNSESLEQDWQKPVTPEQLQAEMERMAQHSKQPEVLHELFEALGNDPFVIAECLARPVLAERFANSDPVAAGMPPQKPVLAGWLAKAETQVPVTMAAVSSANYTLPVIASPSGGCIDDTWTPTTLRPAPSARHYHTAVWTGSEMIVWGGYDGRNSLNTGGRYDPSTDSWTATSTTNAPTARYSHTAVWTGNEMIVWGGYDSVTVFNTGGRYNPSTDSWTATSTTNAPEGRFVHTAVWTGNEMIIWGGGNIQFLALNTGGRYDPGTDSWTATSTTNAADARAGHTAVWTGSEMIVWGGDSDIGRFDTGGRYNPSTDSWTPTSRTNAPDARVEHTAVWTGSEMIVWGGSNSQFVRLNTGGRYCAQAGSPTPTPTPPAQITLRAEGRKVNGVDTVRLTWSGATSSQVDIYRCVQQLNGCDPALIATTANNGRYIDSTGHTGQAGFRYKVCEAGTRTCSKTASVTFQR